jgi:hypothetical protein
VAAREQSGTNIDPGVIARVVAGVRYAISGAKPTDWFGPSQPVTPVAQAQAEGRAFDYPVGVNLRQQPRSEEALSFAQLRGVADGYDLLRLVIETRKDQIGSFEWEIVPKQKGDSADKHKDAIAKVRDFLERPDREHNWDQWLRMQVEDLLVIDAIAVYPRQTRGGGLYAFELIDPATIKRVLDVNGRTPLPPDPAYQQILKGLAAADYSGDQLIYTMRNPRTSRIYGLSPVEQVITTVNIALRRQMSQLAFYTEGNVPEAIAQVPASWTLDQIADFQTWWDSVMEGNAAAKRKMRFIPNLDGIVFPKDAVLKDEYDDWLARIVCFAFSVTPSALIKQVNRASGEQMSDTAKEEGLLPLLRFIATHVTALVNRYLDAPELKFQFKVLNKVDPESQAKIHGIYIDKQVLSPDEVREDIDRDAMTPEQRAEAFPPPVMATEHAEPDGDEAKPEPKVEPKPTEPTAAEKMLADAIRLLDPSLVAAAIEKAAASQAPRIVEVRPAVNVEVGDTNVHVPVRKDAQADQALTKRSDAMAEAISALAARDPVINFTAPDVIVNMPAQTINVAPAEVHHTTHVAPAEVHPTINVAAPDVRVEAPVTVNTPATQIDVHVPTPGATEKLIDRNHNGDIVRVVEKPIH